MTLLENYLAKVGKSPSSAVIAFLAGLDHLKNTSPQVAAAIIQELKDQRNYLKLIASENYSSLGVWLSMGNLLTDKYAEGYSQHRFYAGCDNVDTVESLATEHAKKLFNAEHAYVQPHSGADANLVAYWAILMQRVQNKELAALGNKKLEELSSEDYAKLRRLLSSQKIMGLALDAGGHLTHGFKHNVSGKMFDATSYTVDGTTGLLDYALIAKTAQEVKPLILLAGYSAYPRKIDFAKMREIADSVGAVLMVDMAHFAGLVAGKVFTGDFDPVPFAHVVTSTTHKTLRGPRGGLILCKEEFKETIDKGCPLVLGGPMPHVMAAKAVAFEEALQPNFATYAQQIVKNSQALAAELLAQGAKLTTGGTDNHLLVIDVGSYNLSGRIAENALRAAHLTVNRNSIPNDPKGAWYTSGVRVGTPALTSRGFKEADMKEVASCLVKILKNTKPSVKDGKMSLANAETNPLILKEVQQQVAALLQKHPLYPEILL